MAGIGGVHGAEGGSMFADHTPVVLDAQLTDIYHADHPVQYVIRASVDADLLPDFTAEVERHAAVGQFCWPGGAHNGFSYDQDNL